MPAGKSYFLAIVNQTLLISLYDYYSQALSYFSTNRIVTIAQATASTADPDSDVSTQSIIQNFIEFKTNFLLNKTNPAQNDCRLSFQMQGQILTFLWSEIDPIYGLFGTGISDPMFDITYIGSVLQNIANYDLIGTYSSGPGGLLTSSLRVSVAAGAMTLQGVNLSVWSTNNTGVATIDGFGLLTPVAPGTCYIGGSAGDQSVFTLPITVVA